MSLLSAVKTITRSFTFFFFFPAGRLYHWTTSESALEPGKLGNSAFLVFCRRLALENISGADCLHASRISFKESAVLAAEMRLPPSPQAVLALLCLPWKGKLGRLWHGGATLCNGWACFTYTETTHFGEKNTNNTTVKLTLCWLFFTHTKYFAALAIIVAHIQM